MELSAFRARFQPILESYLRDAVARDAALAQDSFLERLIRYAEPLAASDGKRVRPYMAWLMYRASGGDDREEVMRMLVSLELFHVFALVHDDVMDRGLTRHGMPTMHRMAAEALQADKRLGDAARVGDAHAILIGDLIFQWSQAVFYGTAGIDAVMRERAAAFFHSMIEEVIVGQMMDIDLTTRITPTDAFVERRTYLKTSTYTFVRPLQIGAALGGASADVIAWCEPFGTALGRAFQIQDDLIDLVHPSIETGKTSFSDLQEGQQTVFTQYILSHGTEEQKTELRALMGSPLTESDRPRVTALFESSGAFAYGRAEISASYQEADRLLASAQMSDAWRGFFQTFVEKLKNRER
jgi:geranylgeranyl diphosphate synthase type I